jgi:hypothetical protein
MRFIFTLSAFVLLSSCTSQPGQKVKVPHAEFQQKFVSEYFQGVKRVECLADFDSPLIGFQDNFAFLKIQHQTEKLQGCQVDFQTTNVDQNLQAAQATLQFACWMSSFTGFANLFDYAAMDRLKITETDTSYVFQDGQVLVNFLKDLSVADIKFKKDDIRIAVEYSLDKNKKRKWASAVMKAPVPGQQIEIESRVLPVYGADDSWPEKLEVTSIGIRSEISFRNCQKIR